MDTRTRARTALPLLLLMVTAVALLSGCAWRLPDPGRPLAATQRELPDFRPLVDSFGPAVVNVSAIYLPANDPAPHSAEQEEIEQFLRRFGLSPPDSAEPEAPVRRTGSGFIVSPEGYVLTNSHVVKDAATVIVKLADRREFTAKLIGADLPSDVAVLKIEAEGLPFLEFGNPARLRPGQWVAAIGSPFGFDNSVTVGVVSGTGRALPDSDYVPFIQTDVALTVGNSGGPLFDLDGEVVGINSQIATRSGGYTGVSFAIPIDVALDVQEQIIRTGHVVRGRIGVTMQEVTAQLAQSFGLDPPRGALVDTVKAGSPAERAGITAGDIILRLNGRPIEYMSDLPVGLARLAPGAMATMDVWRNRAHVDVTVCIDELEEAPPRTMSNAATGAGTSGGIGLSLRPLTAVERATLRKEAGLLVTGTSGAAALAGIRPGDVVLAVNGTSVGTTQALQAALANSGSVAALLIEREKQQTFVPVPLNTQHDVTTETD